jgi:hypothetical protein
MMSILATGTGAAQRFGALKYLYSGRMRQFTCINALEH